MHKFSRLLINNIFLALVFLGTVAVIAFYFLPTFVSIDDKQQERVIQNISHVMSLQLNEEQPISIDFANELGNLLRQTTPFLSLKIKHKNTELFSYSDPNSIKKATIYIPKEKNLTLLLQKQRVIITYQINNQEQLTLLINIAIALTLLTVSFVLISTWRQYVIQTKLFNIISDQIKHDLSTLNTNDALTTDTKNNILLKIPALQKGIAEIKSLMTAQLQNHSMLETKANQDSLTGLDNRNMFVQFYEEQVVKESPVKFGVLLITRCSELQTINQVQGYNAGDDYISKVAKIMQNALVSHSLGKLFRLNSSDFATILPNEQLKAAEEYATLLTTKFNEYQQISDLESVAFTGLVFFDKSKPLGELLALADTGVSVAQTHQTNAWFSQKDSGIFTNDNTNHGNQNWRQEIDSVIEGQRIRLLLQPIQPSGRNSKVYGEVLARFLNIHDDMLPTASFIAMAEKLDKIIAVDKLIIDTVISEIIDKNMLDQSFGINISARSINDEHFMIWLERKLLREPLAAPRLVFEITEVGLQQNIKNSKRFVDMLHRVGSRVTVERFGLGMTSFKFFRDLTPDYIKMDSSYTHDIDDDKNNQYFLRLMVDLAHRLGINVLAESVESQEEKHTLEKLFIDGCQGFYVGKPTPLE
ncbi:GGDEF domain-containing protein [Colwellia asteriadis]|uniref:EAL domain-containing protein n=1 Tax=Colwellia asteriadis TaxID=517723 RepID=UPI0031DE4939